MPKPHKTFWHNYGRWQSWVWLCSPQHAQASQRAQFDAKELHEVPLGAGSRWCLRQRWEVEKAEPSGNLYWKAAVIRAINSKHKLEFTWQKSSDRRGWPRKMGRPDPVGQDRAVTVYAGSRMAEAARAVGVTWADDDGGQMQLEERMTRLEGIGQSEKGLRCYSRRGSKDFLGECKQDFLPGRVTP